MTALSITASGRQAQPVNATASADVTLPQEPHAALAVDTTDAVGTIFVDSNENGHADTGGDLIEFIIQLTNVGNVVLSNIVTNDPLFGGSLGAPQGGFGDNLLDPGETWVWQKNHSLSAADVAALHVVNDVTVTALDPASNTVTAHSVWDQLLPA